MQCYMNFGSWPQDAAPGSIALLGDYVIPGPKAMDAAPTARGLEHSIALQVAQ
jgi:hypothetical protein